MTCFQRTIHRNSGDKRRLVDAENRLTDVETSRDKIIWEKDARYYYYKHGPLARTILGQNQVQGIDYAYTLQGWLKAVNSLTALPNSNACPTGTAFDELTVTERTQNGTPSTYIAKTSITFESGFETTTNDNFETNINPEAAPCDVASETLATTHMGEDGTVNSPVAKDAYSFALHYFDENGAHDYSPIGAEQSLVTSMPTGFGFTSLFNGNIAAMSVNVPKAGEALLYSYRYDQLNRLISMDAYKGLNPNTNSWEPIAIDDYKERISYDANGNIKTYLRNGAGSSLNLNNYSYSYIAGTNKLQSIINSVNGQTKTYDYDAIGNTTIDGMQGVTNATWNLYGKLKSLTNKDGQNVLYTYSPDGQRISKKVGNTEEWYVRDAAGNIMASYKKDAAINSGHISTNEFYKYGSNLLAIQDKVIDMEATQVAGMIQTQERGDDGYILSDQSGNTRAIVSDKKIQHSSDGTTVDSYTADVKNANLYSTYGAIAKSYGASPIVAFNGQRKSTEIGDNAQTAQFWEYNGDVGRRWNLDPKPIIGQSYYSVLLNNPNITMDIKGDTVILGEEFKNNKHLMESYRIFSNSKQGKKFLQDFGLTGKYSNITVTINSKNFYYGAGETNPFSVNPKNPSDKVAIRAPGDASSNTISRLRKGDQLKFNIDLNWDQVSEDQAKNGNAGDILFNDIYRSQTILHETQHVRIFTKQLIESKAKMATLTIHMQHDLMKNQNKQYFKDRLNFMYHAFTPLTFALQLFYNKNDVNKNEKEYFTKLLTQFDD